MKKKKNIIKKTELNKIYKLSFKKGFKHYFKKSRLKNKFFFKISCYMNSFYKINKLAKYVRKNILEINKNFIIKRYSYFNYITNGLDLKYDEHTCQDLSNLNYINQLNNKRNILIKISDLDILKFQKFITYLDQVCINIENLNQDINDYFDSTNNIYYSFLKNNYKLSYLLLIIKCF